MANPRRYLLPSERLAVEVRRHWAVLATDTLQTVLLIFIGVLLYRILPVSFIRTMAVFFILFVLLRFAFKVWDWQVEKLVVTDKRVLLVTGIVTRKVAIMPLVKVTDLTYNRSSMGLLLGYGEFVIESAGQDQALSRINYIPQPERLYIQISELLFGGDKGGVGALPSPSERDAELEEGRRALQRRWRRFGGTRRRRGRATDPAAVPTGEPTFDDAYFRTVVVERDSDSWPDRDEEPPTTEFPRIHEPPRESGRGGTLREPPVSPPQRPGPPPPRPRLSREGEDDPPPSGPQYDPGDD